MFVRLVGQQTDLFKVRPDGSGLVRLTLSGLYDNEPTWYPDGRRLLASADGRLVLRSRGRPPAPPPPGCRVRAELVARRPPDRVLVSRCPQPRFDDTCADLWVIRPDGAARRRLAAADVDLTLESRRYAWAPDGGRVVYTKAGAPGGLVVVTVRDGSKRTLAGTRGALSTHPTWSPDGRWITFSRQRGSFQGSDLYAVTPLGTSLHRLTRGGDVSRSTWSPDGRRIAYMRSAPPFEGEPRWSVVVAAADGRRARPLAVTTESTVLLWSPDSSRLLWSTFFLRLMTARADGSGGPKLVTTGEVPDWG